MVRVLPLEEVIDSRDGPAVCIPWPDEYGLASETIASILLYTSSTSLSHVPILLSGASERDLERVRAELGEHGCVGGHDEAVEHEIVGLLGPEMGFAQAVNSASHTTSCDLVLVAPGVRVGPEWLERLSAAAHCDSTVVSATALGDHTGALSVAVEPAAGPSAAKSPAAAGPTGPLTARRTLPTQPAAALAVIARSPRAYPRVASAGAHCVYLRRALLERLEPLDTGIPDPAEAMAELSLRALSLGMVHVAADDVFVLCPPERRPAGAPLLSADISDERTVLRRSLACARVALGGMSVTIDARALGPSVGGTQVYTRELILALASSHELRVRVVVAPGLPDAVAQCFREQPALEVVTYDQALAGVEPSDVVHRPQQVFSADDLALLHILGERVIIGQQDLIAYRNPAYHATIEDWQRYRRVTRLAMTVADRAVFFSAHAMRDAVAEDLASPGRCDVAGIGADLLGAEQPAPAPVDGVPREGEMLVCLGADYRHKNRPFAIALLEALRRRHGWQGCLVLAGAHVPHGSSREEEAALLARHPDITGSVIDVGLVDEAQKAWLLQRACAVVYPTLYEGFGLVPFEAARAGAPCLYAPQASLLELADPPAATLVPWDAQRSSDAVAALLRDGPEREGHLRLLLDGAMRSRWSEVVARLLDTYRKAIDAPYRAAAPRAWQELERERHIARLGEDVEHLKAIAEDYQHAYQALRADVGIGLPLVAEGGLLSRNEQRGLMRVASRRALHGLMLTPVGLLGRLGGTRASGSSGSEPDAESAERGHTENAPGRW